MELVKNLHGASAMKLSPYTKAVLAAYRELKAAGKSYEEIRSDPRALEMAGSAKIDHQRQEQNQLDVLDSLAEKEKSP